MGKKVAFHNLGCKVNAYETEAMQQLLEEAGYTIVPFEPGADIYVINTCTVTGIADRKSRQMLHRAKKMNPDAVVVAAGCYAQTDEEGLLKDESVDIILGNNRKGDLLKVLRAYEAGEKPEPEVIPIRETREYENLSIHKTTSHVRAFLKVQDGCDQFCSYCVIPLARGRVRSRDREDVCREVTSLAQNGCREVVLNGIHLSSYGRDLPGEESLLTLIRSVQEIPGIARIRLGSLEPGIITEDFVRGIHELDKVCPHFHLSLQSGCDDTLKRMNRHYTSEQYAEKCELLRRYYGNPALTTDIIVGFPGESEEEFKRSIDFVSGIHFYETHVFKYSPRKGTRAASMPDQKTEAVKEERSREMISLSHQRSLEYEKSLIGRELEVLLEEQEGEDRIVGHSREYVKAAVPAGGPWKSNDLVTIRVNRAGENRLLEGEILGR